MVPIHQEKRVISLSRILFFELKSGHGSNLEEALQQARSSMVILGDGLKDTDISIFLVVVKGKFIGFFEYHNYRNVLYEDDISNMLGAVPFNTVPKGVLCHFFYLLTR